MDEIYQDGDYLANNPNWHEEDSGWKAEKIHSLMQRNGIAPASVVEVGCGVGQILVELQRKLPNTTSFSGYEISPQAFERCQTRKNASLSFFLEDFLAADTETFECSLAIDVVEHIEDHFDFLRKLRSKAQYHIFHIPLEMSAAGVLRDWMLQTRYSLGHIHYFTTPLVLALLKDTGYEIVDHHLTCGDDELPKASGLSITLARGIRRTIGFFSEDAAAKLIGGFSLIVLARSQTEAQDSRAAE